MAARRGGGSVPAPVSIPTRRSDASSPSHASHMSPASFFPLLWSDPGSQAHAAERAYYAREEAALAHTQAQMDECQSITDAMLSILDSFDDKLSALESSMLPIHKGTQALTTAQRHIDLTLAETEQILTHYQMATESDAASRAHVLNSVDYAAYLDWVERIHMSINFFTRNKERLQHGLDSSAAGVAGVPGGGGAASATHASDCDKYLRKLKELNKRVMAECEGEFERVLAASSKNPLDLQRTGWPLPATLSMGDGGSNAGGAASVVPFQLVPAFSVQELALIAQRMALAGNHGYFGILLAQRTAFLRATLKKLFHEELKFMANNGTLGAGGAQQPVLMQMRGSILRATHTRGTSIMSHPADASSSSSSSLPASSSSSSSSSSHLYQKRSHKSVFYLEFFLKLLELEHAFLSQCVEHVFRYDELKSRGLATKGGGSGGGGGTAESHRDASSAPSSHHPKLQSQGSALSLQSSVLSLGTQASTGHLSVFWGAEAYDQLYANIVEVPLEYFRKKMEQHTYLKEAPLIKLSHVFGSHHSGGGGGGHKDGVGGSSSGVGVSGGGLGSSLSLSTSGGPSLPLSTGTQLSNKILILLDVLEQLNVLLPRYRILLKRHSQFDKMVELQGQLIALARKALAEYREYMLDYNDKLHHKSGVKDGTIYTLTVETLNFLKRLCEYRGVIDATSTLLDKHHHQHAAAAAAAERAGEGAVASEGMGVGMAMEVAAFPVSPGDSTFHSLCGFLLRALELNMAQRARSLKPPSLAAIWMLNNFHHMAKFLRKNAGVFTAGSGATSGAAAAAAAGGGLSVSVGGRGTGGGGGGGGGVHLFIHRYDHLSAVSMKQYRTCSWEKMVSGALEVSEIHDLARAFTHSPLTSSTHKAARKAIKAKFALFNQCMEDAYNTQRHYSIPDSELRTQLRNDNVELILSSYRTLYSTFLPLDFSTNPAKYTKYTPAVLEAMLAKFFDEEGH